MMVSTQQPPVQGNARRRTYVFFTVATAVFLLGIVAIGYACHGFSKFTVKMPLAAERPDDAKVRADCEAANQEYASARIASAAALAKYEAAQKKFLDFIGTHFGELTANIPAANSISKSIVEQAEKDNQPPVEPEPVVIAPPPAAEPAMVANPEWNALRTQLEELQHKRKTLLVTLTPSHPAVATVDFDIADVESKLQSVPAQIAGKGESAPQIANTIAPAPTKPVEKHAVVKREAPTSPPKPAMDLAAWAARWNTDDQKFRELAEQLNEAQLSYRQAQQHESIAQDAQVRSAAALAKANVKIQAVAIAEAEAKVEAAQSVPTGYVGARPRPAIGWCSLFALLLALVVARYARVTEPVFRAAAAVRQALELPILGILARQPSQIPREQPGREPRWVHGAVIVAELWLVAVAVVLAASALSDQQFLRDLISNPLSACSRKFWC